MLEETIDIQIQQRIIVSSAVTITNLQHLKLINVLYRTHVSIDLTILMISQFQC